MIFTDDKKPLEYISKIFYLIIVNDKRSLELLAHYTHGNLVYIYYECK